MKRTEKIEVRLSHEEKTSLTTLAEKEGRSVSRLVREVVSKYMDLNTANSPSKMAKPRLAACLALAAVTGFAVNGALSLSGKSEVFALTGHVNGSSFDMPLHRKAKTPQILDVKTKSGTYQLAAKFGSHAKLSNVELVLCQKKGTICDPVSTDTLVLHSENKSTLSAHIDNASWAYAIEGPNYLKRNNRS